MVIRYKWQLENPILLSLTSSSVLHIEFEGWAVRGVGLNRTHRKPELSLWPVDAGRALWLANGRYSALFVEDKLDGQGGHWPLALLGDIQPLIERLLLCRHYAAAQWFTESARWALLYRGPVLNPVPEKAEQAPWILG